MGKKSRDLGKRGENDARRALCEAFEVPYCSKRYPRSSGVQAAGATAPDLLGFPWHVEVKAGEAAENAHPWTKKASNWRDKAMMEAAAENNGLPVIVMRKAAPGRWMVSSWQTFWEGPTMWIELPLNLWADVEMYDERICRWRDEVCVDEIVRVSP